MERTSVYPKVERANAVVVQLERAEAEASIKIRQGNTRLSWPSLPEALALVVLGQQANSWDRGAERRPVAPVASVRSWMPS